MPKKEITLEQKTTTELLEIIEDIEKNFYGVSAFIRLNYLLAPNQKIKKIEQNYNKLKKKTKFHDYYETIAFCNELSQSIILPLKPLNDICPEEVVKLLERIVDEFEKLFDSKDDSSGCAMEFLYECFTALGEAWHHMPSDGKHNLPLKIIHYYQHHGYIGMEIFSYFKAALGKEGLCLLEEHLKNDSKALLHVIELQNEPDKYQKAMTSMGSNTEYLLTLAQLFIHHWRYEEGIETLQKIPETIENDQHYRKREELLIHALTKEGKIQQAQEERWRALERTLDATYYRDFIKDTPIEEQATYRLKALKISKNKAFIYRWSFLEDILEYSELSQLILDNLDKLNMRAYVKKVRDSSKVLAANGYFLAASLMRRILIDNVLAESASRYYHYAVSDLKLSLEFGEKVTNWESFMNNQTYLDKIKNENKRKTAFWGLANKSKLPITSN